MLPLLLAVVLQEASVPRDLPRVHIEHDDSAIERSCRLEIPSEPIADANGNGVIQIAKDGVTVDFDGAWLRGAGPTTPLDELEGYGMRITAKDVTIKNARIAGFKGGIWASGADGLMIEDCRFEGNYAQRLMSTPLAEDGADWLFPHDNDENQWLVQHGAAIYVEDCQGVTLRRIAVRKGQNGLLLDRVNDAKVYDNDASFLSGWGLALWRSSRNLISRNAFDFCIRGYSHGVYNRGQDSAGILMFEQCCENVIVENSATHGGDGFFGFAGREALGEKPPTTKDFDYKRRGCNDNILCTNDFSYAAAHGIEMTFSFGNKLVTNRLIANAICGVWGGYSQDTLIAGNEISRNGQMAYGSERGGVNIEHGQANRIEMNRFAGNVCGVHLWWDADEELMKSPWARANGGRCEANSLFNNVFDSDALALHLRSCSATAVAHNFYKSVGRELDTDDSSTPLEPSPLPRMASWTLPPDAQQGRSRPVGARKQLEGRDKIVMTEWGPYDWESPLLQRIDDREGAHVWRLLGNEPLIDAKVTGEVVLRLERGAKPYPLLVVAPRKQGALSPYEINAESEKAVTAMRTSLKCSGVLISARWQVQVFAYTHDPREHEAEWRKEARSALAFEVSDLDLPYGMAGPSQLARAGQAVADAKLPSDHFGTLARTSIGLPAGTWEFRLTSDDGARLLIDGTPLIQNWTWHVPTTDKASLRVPETRQVELAVEHFELAGFATLRLEIAPVPGR